MKIDRVIAFLFLIGLITSSCIHEKSLYQGDKDEDTGDSNQAKEVISKPEFMYPFGNETTAKKVEITFRLKTDKHTENLHAEIPPLKYNKEWLLMLTQDDCMHAAFCYTWAAIHGKPLSKTLYYDLAHLQNGDLPPDHYTLGKTLGSTDGTGKEVRFSFTTTLAAEWDYMDATTNIRKGFTENNYRFYMKSGLVWGNVQEMTNYGVSVAFHDVKFPTNEKTTAKLIEHFDIAQKITLGKLNNRISKMLAEPNGDKMYIEAAQQYAPIQTICAQAGAVKLYPFKEDRNLEKMIIERGFYNASQNSKVTEQDMIKSDISKELQSPREKRKAIYIGVHNTDTDWVNFLKWLNDTYGKDGDDSMWMPNQEEYYEYYYYRHHCQPEIERIDDRTWKLTFKLKGQEAFYYPAVTVNIPGLKAEEIERIESSEDVTGLSFADYKDALMLNIDCRKFLAEHAENFVKRYEANTSDTAAKADALYFVNMLKESEKKDNLIKRILK